MRAKWLTVSLLIAALAAGFSVNAGTAAEVDDRAADREAILAHIHSIFDAYLRKDRETIKNTHTEDWTGFQGPSTKIERGIDDYMVNADKSLESLDGTGYELLDTEIQFYGDIAIVFYVATYDFETKDGWAGSLPLRSIDLYRKDDGHWIQFGSHITTIPGDATWGEERDESGGEQEAEGEGGSEN